jgi:uncharacterized membrane protein
MSNAEAFLSAKEEKQIIAAIKEAEKNTSGEIRIHIDEVSETDVFIRAKQAFIILEMDKTKNHNGVLFYVSVKDSKFAICGDIGIDKVTPDDFWEEIKDTVISHFKRSEFVDGLVKGVEMAGESLKKYFPYKDDDLDELPDEISYEGKAK